MRALDWLRRIDFVDLHDGADLTGRHPELSQERLMSEIHVLDAEGRLYAGFAGTRRMLKEVPLGFPLWLLLQLPGTDALGRWVYRFIARRRYRINALLGVELPDCADGNRQMPR
jgi:predicted DCC family thiol-disulfide oxidoreductase YuxK